MDGTGVFVFGAMADKPLTLKQEKFIAAYLGEANGNATEAARIAGYKHPGQYGHDLLKNREIDARIAKRVREYTGTAQEVLDELYDVATSDWKHFIEVLSVNRDGEPVKVRMDMSSKIKALELLGKYHQLFIDRQQVDVTIREQRVGLPQSTIVEVFQPSEHDEPKALTG
jgi:phage terminase small subunit